MKKPKQIESTSPATARHEWAKSPGTRGASRYPMTRNRTHTKLAATIALALSVALAAPVSAADPQAAGITTRRVPIAGTRLVRGHSTVVVDAPLAKVREHVLAFAAYPEFMPHYKTAKVLGRTPSGGRNVYMEVTALHGAVKMWARVEVQKPAPSDALESHEIRFLEGNVKELSGAWRLRRIDASKTELTLEIFLNPSLPLPASLINEENLDGSRKGVDAMRKRIEQSP